MQFCNYIISAISKFGIENSLGMILTKLEWKFSQSLPFINGLTEDNPFSEEAFKNELKVIDK